jgi:hypothetical protein
VVTDNLLKQLRSFHARIARYITGKYIRQNEDGSWFHPPTAEVLEEAGLHTVPLTSMYIRRRRDTVRNFVRLPCGYDQFMNYAEDRRPCATRLFGGGSTRRSTVVVFILEIR